MKMTYHPDIDLLHLKLSDRALDVTVPLSEGNPMIHADVDKEGNVIALEVLGASELLKFLAEHGPLELDLVARG